MTKHTRRDQVWNESLRMAINEESFSLSSITQAESVDMSKKTVLDVLNTLDDLGWLTRESSQPHKWGPGPLTLGKNSEDIDSKTSVQDEALPVSRKDSSSSLSEGKVYFGTVDRVNSNAIINLRSGEINLGPIDKAAVGETVEFEFVGGVWGECLNDEYTYDGYDPHDGESRSRSSSSNSKRDTTRKPTSEIDPNNKNKLLSGKL